MIPSKVLLSAVLAMLPGAALADGVVVPALQPAGLAATPPTPPPVTVLSNKTVTLTAKEKAGLGLSRTWTARPDMPAAGDDGAVRFLYGSSLPSVVCAPLYVCDIALQAGEVINDINVGDSVRWKISPATSGVGTARILHVVVKPTDAGLTTNLAISTDRRSYFIKLVSTKAEWMPSVAFTYPDEVQRQWSAYQQNEARDQAATTLPGGQKLAELDFAFVLTGDAPAWKPLRVYADGAKTYIQFPPSVASGDAPALVALANDGGIFSSPSEQLVNYRLSGSTFVVDKVLAKAALISGVGSAQQRVTITHSSGGR
jgi:type IV secretion system protein VirB9